MNDKPFITVSVDRELKERVVSAAMRFGLSQSDITRMALIAFLEQLRDGNTGLGLLRERKEEV